MRLLRGWTARAAGGGDEMTFLIVGLGNPGPSYAGNRHNVGFRVLDVLGDRIGGKFRSHKGKAHVLEGRLAGVRVVLVKPRSYMNESGGPVSSVRGYFSVPVEKIVVVHDELDLPFGHLRLKQGGGDNGHNGLRSISAALGSKEYHRLRFGIDRPTGRQDPAQYVLRDFAAPERAELGERCARAADAIEVLLADGLAAAQNQFND